MQKKRLSLYGWTAQHDQMAAVVYQKLREQGIRFDHDGKPNVSAILLYLLEQAARQK